MTRGAVVALHTNQAVGWCCCGVSFTAHGYTQRVLGVFALVPVVNLHHDKGFFPVPAFEPGMATPATCSEDDNQD